MPEEILSLSTIVTRPTINITTKKHPNGKLYELRNLADLGPYEHAIIFQRSAEVDALRKLKKLTPAQERREKKLLDDTVTLVVFDIEPAVLNALTNEQKELIVVTWSAHITTERAAEGNARPNRQSRRTTGASSQGCKRSTAATRKRGSTARRGS